MKHCKTCKWWKPEEDRAFVENDAANICTNSTLLGERDDVDGSRLDTLQYSYDEGGYIYTGPEFGCVHYRYDDLSSPEGE